MLNEFYGWPFAIICLVGMAMGLWAASGNAGRVRKG